eukprot:CAMPEP_0181302006 /NCGR_PEP_ID=MMETSP1101-20121128/7734_1 /TAXON_ID=46948 /ORGANISM="Rhodomonas abbreviata, Strain Caron Lab Isolate" /LENGTH=76 /DNA_ID=CAMNT_0023407363 /DNA_START=17 /DNA_END=247 /DNA_ORIENTATION=+
MRLATALFYYSPSPPLKTYSENPICSSYLGSNCVAMGSGVTDDYPMQQAIPTMAGPRTYDPETDAVGSSHGLWISR